MSDTESLQDEIDRLKRARERERKARERAEHLLESKSRELYEANEALVQSQTHMVHSEKMAGLGQMAAGVAHEINNPVGFILSNLGTLDEYVEVIMRFHAGGAPASLFVEVLRNDTTGDVTLTTGTVNVVPTPGSETSFTETRACGFTCLRSKMSCARSSME